MDATDLVKTFGGGFLGGLIGIVGAYLKASNRVEKLEEWKKDFTRAYKEVLDKSDADREKYRIEIHQRFENLGKAWTLALDQRDGDLNEKINELKGEIKEQRESFNRFIRSSHSDFASDDKFSKFVQEMNAQWKAVERTLGHIEGWMESHRTIPPRR